MFVCLCWWQVDTLFGEPLSALRSSCTTEEHRKLDVVIQEVMSNIETLKAELLPQNDYQQVEEQLDLSLQQVEDVEKGKSRTKIYQTIENTQKMISRPHSVNPQFYMVGCYLLLLLVALVPRYLWYFYYRFRKFDF